MNFIVSFYSNCVLVLAGIELIFFINEDQALLQTTALWRRLEMQQDFPKLTSRRLL